MAKCQRDGCEVEVKPKCKHCSHRCAGIVNAAKRPADFYTRMGKLGHAGRRKAGAMALMPSDRMLMAAGRYEEAARSIRNRGYCAGWIAGRKGNRQLPERRIA